MERKLKNVEPLPSGGKKETVKARSVSSTEKLVHPWAETGRAGEDLPVSVKVNKEKEK